MIFGAETENDNIILDYIEEIGDNMKKSFYHKNSKIRFIPKLPNKFILLFNIPKNTAVDVVSGFFSLLLVASVIIRALAYGLMGIVWYQYFLIAVILIVLLLASPLFFYLAFVLGARKKGFKGKIKKITPAKVLQRVYFDKQ